MNKSTFGERLRNARRSMRMSQAELAHQCGVERRAQAYYEADERFPDAGYLLALSRIARAEIDYVVTGRLKAALPQFKEGLQALGVPERQAMAMTCAIYGRAEAGSEGLDKQEDEFLAAVMQCSKPFRDALLDAAKQCAGKTITEPTEMRLTLVLDPES